jgi:hypothetical protein
MSLYIQNSKQKTNYPNLKAETVRLDITEARPMLAAKTLLKYNAIYMLKLMDAKEYTMEILTKSKLVRDKKERKARRTGTEILIPHRDT